MDWRRERAPKSTPITARDKSHPSSSYFRLLRTLLRMRRTMAAVARHHFDLFTDNVFNDFEDFPGSSLPEESSNSSRGHSHFCRKERRGSKEFQVVALSGGCVFLGGEEMARIPPFRASPPIWLPLPAAATHNHIYDDHDHTAAFQSL